MFAFAGSNVTPATYPDLGCAEAHVVLEVEVRAILVLTINPSLKPATAIFAFEGATARELTLPLPGVTALAWVQLDAPFVVRQRKKPPVHRRCEFDGSIMKGAIKRKSFVLSVIPDVALLKDGVPGFVDF